MKMHNKTLCDRKALRSQEDSCRQVVTQVNIMVTEDNNNDKQGRVSPLKWLRNRVGLSQSDLAVVLGVSRTTITHWETGRKKPELEIWQTKALCKALQVTLDELPNSFAPTSTSDHEKSEG